jgi:hypothetical protein
MNTDLKALFAEARADAADRSLLHTHTDCSVHINAVINVIDGLPVITGFRISDWMGGETVATFVNGKELS